MFDKFSCQLFDRIYYAIVCGLMFGFVVDLELIEMCVECVLSLG